MKTPFIHKNNIFYIQININRQKKKNIYINYNVYQIIISKDVMLKCVCKKNNKDSKKFPTIF